MARQARVEHLIHNQDGTIAERNSYGNVPPGGPFFAVYRARRRAD